MPKHKRQGPKASILEDPAALPDLLFHYTRRDTAVEHILGTRQFRLSPFGLTNDPLEFKDWSFLLVGSGLPPDGIDNKHFQSEFELNNVVKERAKLACFTADGGPIGRDPSEVFRRGFARSRMWSQYGEQHRGVCLVFSKAGFRQEVSALKKAEEDRIYEGSVSYKDFSPEAINARTLNGDKLKEMAIREYVAGHLDDHYKALFLEKAQDYRDENEYRFILANSAPGFAYVPIDGCLEAVIAGVLLPTVYRDLIARLAHELGAEYKSLGWHNGRPYLSNQ